MKKLVPVVVATLLSGWSMDGFGQTSPTLATPGGTDPRSLGDRLKTAAPTDLAAAIAEAQRQLQTMTPAQRAAASGQAQILVPVLMGEVMAWWQSLTPQQQTALGAQLNGFNDALIDPALRRYIPR